MTLDPSRAANIFVSLVLASLCCVGGSARQPAPVERFAVTGTVVDADGNPVNHSIVIPLSGFGVPLNKQNAQPLSWNSLQQFGDEDFVLFTRTDERGVFQVDLPVGQYRIVAQSWLDQPHVTNLMAKNGSQLRIDGVTEMEFGSEMEAAETIEIRPAGSGTVRLTSQEASDMLLISTQPLAGDPVLGFMALTGGFWGGLLGGTRMENRAIAISGLPDGEIQFFSFVNDNNGGMGGVMATVVAGQISQVHLPVIAGWSNGHRTPPAELEPLVGHFRDHPEEIQRLMNHTEALQKQCVPDNPDDPAGHRFELQVKMAAHLQDEYQLASGDRITLADAWAAMAYSQMNR